MKFLDLEPERSKVKSQSLKPAKPAKVAKVTPRSQQPRALSNFRSFSGDLRKFAKVLRKFDPDTDPDGNFRSFRRTFAEPAKVNKFI